MRRGWGRGPCIRTLRGRTRRQPSASRPATRGGGFFSAQRQPDPANFRRPTCASAARPWRGAAWATPGPTPRSAASSSMTAASSAAPSPRPGGRPHAEPQALAMAGARGRGATAYVTLEPCCHRGRTPPCTDALIAAGVARVVIAARDPDPRVNGAGRRQTARRRHHRGRRRAGRRGRGVLAGFLSAPPPGRPLVTLKLASTLDGRIATHSGESRWITGEPARRAAHALRGRHDADHGRRRHGAGRRP